MKVRLLTATEAGELLGVEFAPNSTYNPILDGVGRWIISEEEAQQTTDNSFLWVQALPIIEYIAPPFQM